MFLTTLRLDFWSWGTHEDIDQRFSVLSRHLRLNDALTPSEFRERLSNAYSERRTRFPKEQHEGKPVVKYIFSMHAFSECVLPYLDTKYFGVSVPLLFQFYRCHVRGHAVQRWKHCSTSAIWYPKGDSSDPNDTEPILLSVLSPDCPLSRTVFPHIRDLQPIDPAMVTLVKKTVVAHVKGCLFIFVHSQLHTLYFFVFFVP